MFICVISTDILTQKSRHVKIPFVDPPHTGTPSQAPEAGLKVVLIAWSGLFHRLFPQHLAHGVYLACLCQFQCSGLPGTKKVFHSFWRMIYLILFPLFRLNP